AVARPHGALDGAAADTGTLSMDEPVDPGVAVSTATSLPPRRHWSRRYARHLLGLRGVLNALLVLAVLYTLVLAQSLVIPLVVAAARWRVPRALSALMLMLALGAGIGAGVTSLAQPAADWLQHAPRALRHVAPKLKPVTTSINAATRSARSLIETGPASR